MSHGYLHQQRNSYRIHTHQCWQSRAIPQKMESLDVNNLEAGNTLGEILQDLQQRHHQTSWPLQQQSQHHRSSAGSTNNSSSGALSMGTSWSSDSPVNTCNRHSSTAGTSYSSANNSSRSTITVGTSCSWTSPTNTSIRCAIGCATAAPILREPY